MTDSADPRIALMQKWSQENPELLAHAGLSSAYESSNNHLDAFTVLRPNTDKTHIDITNQKTEKAWRKFEHEHKHNKKHNNTKAVPYTKEEINGVVKATQAGALTAHGNVTTQNNKKKKGKNTVKYVNEPPAELSQKTLSTRLDIEKSLPTISSLTSILKTHFRASDLAREAVDNVASNYTSFFNNSRDFESAHSILYKFVNAANSINLGNGLYRNVGYTLKSPNFNMFGPETKPLMQKAFLVKSLYEILYRRYAKTIPHKTKDPSKSKQNPEQAANIASMIDEFKKIDKPYELHMNYGKAMRTQKNKAILAKQEYAFKNHSLRDEFDETHTTFSMAQPYSLE